MLIEYSIGNIRKNKVTSISIMATVFVAALFISALCSLFYNIWVDDVIRRSTNGSDLQARSVNEIIKQELQSMREPSLLLVFYICTIILVCISLVLIIKNAFQFSMNSRLHQLGILQSVGATPGQLRTVLLQEALLTSLIPIICGIILGIFLSISVMRYANTLQSNLGLTKTEFSYHYLLFVITMIFTFGTAVLSAWIPAIKMSKITPLQAIKGEYEPSNKRIRKFSLTSAIFGIEGELSRKSLYTRRKALRTATICLTVSFLIFTVFQNFMTVSEVNAKQSLYERYSGSNSDTEITSFNDFSEIVKANAEIYNAYKRVLNVICGLFACIGIANVFANTLVYIFQRKREFARYQSLGLTPEGLVKIFFVEFFIMGVKPILISIPFNIFFILWATNVTGVGIGEFVSEMPILSIFVFSGIMLASVGISYFIAGRQMMKNNIINDLKNDIMI
jgi:ABC-type antimicrobial peptide transport system permease subunit